QATEDTAWDAWRRPDGSWTLELSFSAAGRTRQAHWMADLDNRTVSALDDEARWITDEEAPPEPLRGRARLMAVKSSVYDLEADGPFDDESRGRGARGPQRGSGPVSSEHPAALGDRELDALNARRGLRSVPPPEDSTPDSATVWSSLDEDSTTDPVDPARSQPHEPAWGSLVEPPGTPAEPGPAPVSPPAAPAPPARSRPGAPSSTPGRPPPSGRRRWVRRGCWGTGAPRTGRRAWRQTPRPTARSPAAGSPGAARTTTPGSA